MEQGPTIIVLRTHLVEQVVGNAVDVALEHIVAPDVADERHRATTFHVGRYEYWYASHGGGGGGRGCTSSRRLLQREPAHCRRRTFDDEMMR